MNEKIAMWIAWHIPKRIVHWCAIRVAAHATQGPYSGQIMGDLTALSASDRFAKDHGLY